MIPADASAGWGDKTSMSAEMPQHQAIERVGRNGMPPPPHARFKPGQSGNPGGRPRGTPQISNIYARLLGMSAEEFRAFEPKNPAEHIAYRQVASAMWGLDALPHVKEITDRTEGRAVTRVADATADEIGQRARALFDLLNRAANGLTQAVIAAIEEIKVSSDPVAELERLIQQVNLAPQEIIQSVCAAFSEDQHETVMRALGVE